MAERKVADISVWNSEDNFDYDVFAKNIDGVILRAGYTGWGTGTECNEDSLLSTHIMNLRNKTNLGLYYFSTAMSESIARKEARFCLDMIKKYNLDIKYPIYFDSENSGSDNGIGHQHLSVSELTNVAKAFCEEIEKNGYSAGIYASTSWFNNNMDMSQLDHAVWVADYRGYNGYGDAGMWQYTSEGRVKGYNGNIDLSVDYRDYPERFNSGYYGESEKKEVDYTNIVTEIMNGDWGNGDERKSKLISAGYDYEKVQELVNEFLNSEEKIEELKKELTLDEKLLNILKEFVKENR